MSHYDNGEMRKKRLVLCFVQVRRILLNLAENAQLFNGAIPAKLRKPWYLTTPDIAIMDEDTSFTLSTIGQRLQKVLGLEASNCPYSTRLQVCSASEEFRPVSSPHLYITIAGL